MIHSRLYARSSLGRLLLAVVFMGALDNLLVEYSHCSAASAFMLAPPSPHAGSIGARTSRHSPATTASFTTTTKAATIRKTNIMVSLLSSSTTTTTRTQRTALSSKEIVPYLLQELNRDTRNEVILSKYMTQLEQQQQQQQKDQVENSSSSSSSSNSVSGSSKQKGNTGGKDTDTNKRFEPLVGLYDVSFVQTIRKGDNPVGGKWTRKTGLAQKLLKTRRTFQHILPVNSTGCGAAFASYNSNKKNMPTTKKSNKQGGRRGGLFRAVVGEAVNVISLDALWGWIRLTVILRGDAIPLSAAERSSTVDNCQPLSPLAVRALFDAPRIVLGKKGRFFNVNIGPKTSVILDTLYVDNAIRIGLGGRSGTRFIFRKCRSGDMEANEFRRLLSKRPMKKFKVLTALAAIGGLGLHGALAQNVVLGSIGGGSSASRILLRLLSGCASLVAALLGALIAFSGGGIEADDQSVMR